MEDDREEWPIKVFRDDPVWDCHEKWWMVPLHILNNLFVAAYTYHGYGRPTEASRSVQKIRQEHPGCVLVY